MSEILTSIHSRRVGIDKDDNLVLPKGSLSPLNGTATAAAGAATLNASAGVVTSEALTTAAGADYALTLSSDKIAAGDMVFASVDNGTNTTEGISVHRISPSAGQVIIRVRNTHATVALNGTIKISFFVIKA